MPPPRKTRSGRSAPPPPSKRVRTKGGCLTCRIRRKKCDESRDHNGGCVTCARLHIQCLGYNTKRPDWLKGPQVNDYKRAIKHFLADHNAKSSSRQQDKLLPPMPTWPHPELASQFGLDLPFDYYDPYAPPGGSEDAFPDSMPGLLDLPSSHMLQPNELFTFSDLSALEFDQLTLGSYQNYDPVQASFFELFFNILRRTNAGSLADGLGKALMNDPVGMHAVSDGLATNQNAQLLQSGQDAMHHLWNAGFDKLESRAFACLWLMTGSLSQGDYSLWGNCLDLALKLIYDMCTVPSFHLSSLDAEQQLVVKRGMWSDIVAGATTQRHPQHIDLYRNILRSSEYKIMDCSNETTLAIAETVALAAQPEHLSRASNNLAILRSHFSHDMVEPPSKATVHAAGGLLFLETVANHGEVNNPAVQEAARTVCTLAANIDQQRDVAFWVFLAGCHTIDRDQWNECDRMMASVSESGEKTVLFARDVMKDVHIAQQQGNASPYMWRVQMNQERALLV
ncbi:hypothetical protein FRC07_009851 [Ceratobasidium sp. 392]|nr:hypothetical protein FRC07_009851 [Ceratobasidium sp. 392]